MDQTATPPSLWLLALKYTAFLLNHTSCPSLDNAIPLTVLTGITQDISILLRFHWYVHDTNKLIHCSAVCTAEDPSSHNLCSDNWGDTQGIIKSRNDEEEKSPMALIDIEDLIGKTLNVTMEDATTQEMTIVEAIKAHDDKTKNSNIHTKFKIQKGEERYEEILTYNELMDHLNNLDEGSIHWDF